MVDTFVDERETRARQSEPWVRDANFARMVKFGAYNLMRVQAYEAAGSLVTGYITVLPAIAGKTPAEMERILGLRVNQLNPTAYVYRLLAVPDRNGFDVRGYTTLVDGKRLREGLKQDSQGYRPGHGALQIQLTNPVKAVLVTCLGRHETFEPSMHPKYLL
ncbi:hypothetical protein [Pararhodobacter sp. SW119]|uniref:hypothetical protein n=1 Tax=Pararhodobacter sp. SW119 TaxID=2780075 RepID=UPI001AE06773|nr:hypothetical protein [Pararhodobacter sp. SW119]